MIKVITVLTLSTLALLVTAFISAIAYPDLSLSTMPTSNKSSEDVVELVEQFNSSCKRFEHLSRLLEVRGLSVTCISSPIGWSIEYQKKDKFFCRSCLIQGNCNYIDDSIVSVQRGVECKQAGEEIKGAKEPQSEIHNHRYRHFHLAILFLLQGIGKEHPTHCLDSSITETFLKFSEISASCEEWKHGVAVLIKQTEEPDVCVDNLFDVTVVGEDLSEGCLTAEITESSVLELFSGRFEDLKLIKLHRPNWLACSSFPDNDLEQDLILLDKFQFRCSESRSDVAVHFEFKGKLFCIDSTGARGTARVETTSGKCSIELMS